MEEKRQKVVDVIKEDLLAADLTWSLFLAALKSYRHDSILRPFPNAFVSEAGEKDFETLVCNAHCFKTFCLLGVGIQYLNSKALPQPWWGHGLVWF